MTMDVFRLLPTPASTNAAGYDALFYTWVGLCGFVAAGVFALMIVFSVRYRKGRPADRSKHPTIHDQANEHKIEWTWILVPLVIFVAMFFWAADLYAKLFVAPPDAEQVAVVAKQWIWKAEHRAGQREVNVLHVPLGRPVQLVMTSEDVIHSFFVPAFRIKRDVLPGRYTTIWFTPDRVGTYHLFCAEFCGTDHSRMGGDIVVMPQPAYAAWLTDGNPVDMASRGEALFRQYGCDGCHAQRPTEPSAIRAPRLSGLYGRPVPLAGGGTVVADDRYLHDSIVLPQKDVVAGYDPIMPSYAGRISEEDLLDVIAYLKTMKEEP